MRRKPLWALAAMGLLATPALAADPCSGDACKYILPTMGDGCWTFRNAALQRVRGVIQVGAERLVFEIEPRGHVTPRLKNGACVRDALPYRMTIDTNGRGDPGRRGGGR